jgi:hypothetical protein
LLYLALRRVFELVVLLGRSRERKEIEILVPRLELGVLCRQVFQTEGVTALTRSCFRCLLLRSYQDSTRERKFRCTRTMLSSPSLYYVPCAT